MNLNDNKHSILFHENIFDIFTNLNNEDKNYLLLSLDQENVYWVLKLEEESLSENFLNLIKFILPYGVKIIGILYLGNIEINVFNMRAFSSYFLIKNKTGLVCDKYYSIIINIKNFINAVQQNEISNSFDSIIGSLYNYTKDNLEPSYDINIFKFYSFVDYINNNYILISSIVNPSLVINKNNFSINSLYSNNFGIYFQDMNIIIKDLNNFDKKQNDLNSKKMSDLAINVFIK